MCVLRSSTSLLLIAVVLSSALGCSSTRTREVSLNQVPATPQQAILEHVKGGKIEEIKSKARKGQKWYEVEYRLNNQEYLLVVDEAGTLVEKDRD